MKKIIQQLFAAKIAKSNKPNAWMSDLNGMDDIAALQFSTKQVTQLLSQTEAPTALTPQQQLDLVLEIEALNHARLEKLSTQYASVENMKAELENSICDTCYQYCRQSYIYHLKVIEKAFDANNALLENQIKLEGNTPTLLIARALSAASNMIKWRLFSQTSPPAKVWLQVNVLYRIAAQQKLLNNTVEVFNMSPSTTLAAHFVQTYMLGQLAQASMQKYHVEIATRILNTLVTRAHISNKFTPEQYLFHINLEQDVPAKRMRDFIPSEGSRYWELDELEKQLTVGITVSDRGEIPQSLAFSKIEHTQRLNETLRILHDEWKKSGYVRQRRRTARQASSKTARVSAGIVDICNQVRQANQINSGLRLSLDDRLRAHTVLRQTTGLSSNSGSLDTWIVTDESPRGLGTRVNKYANILARPDKLIGLMIDEDASKIVIGMIRSVRPTQGNQLRVGIEIISHHPTCVQLRQVRTDEVFPRTEAEVNIKNATTKTDISLFSGIYLPIEAGLSEASAMILPKLNFRANSNYTIRIEGSSKHVLLEDPLESHDDWVKVAFPF